jgi:ankyrin repeat protein
MKPALPFLLLTFSIPLYSMGGLIPSIGDLEMLLSTLPPLVIAVGTNEMDTVVELVQNGEDINATYMDGDNLLHIAIEEKLPDMVKLLLQYKIDINHVNNAGETSLHIAAYHGSFAMISLLIQHGAALNILDNCGNNALAHLITALVTDKAYCDNKNKYYLSAHRLIAAGSPITKAFKDIRPNQLTNYTLDKLRILAGDFAQWLKCPDNLKINAQDNDIGATSLMYLAAQGKIDDVKSLLKQGANLFIQDKYGRNVFNILTVILNNKEDLALSHEKQEAYREILKLSPRFIKNLVCIYHTHPTDLIARTPGSMLSILPLDIFKIFLSFVTLTPYNSLSANNRIASAK